METATYESFQRVFGEATEAEMMECMAMLEDEELGEQLKSLQDEVQKELAASVDVSYAAQEPKPKKGKKSENIKALLDKPEEELSDFDLALLKVRKAAVISKKKMAISKEEMDEKAEKFVNKMKEAAETDKKLYHAQQPATKKLMMMNEVQEYVNKGQERQALLEADILGAFVLWLSPYEDGSKPSLVISNPVLDMLGEFRHNISEYLMESKLGILIHAISKNPNETPKIRQKATALVEHWSRQVFNIQTNYMDGDMAKMNPKMAKVDMQARPSFSMGSNRPGEDRHRGPSSSKATHRNVKTALRGLEKRIN